MKKISLIPLFLIIIVFIYWIYVQYKNEDNSSLKEICNNFLKEDLLKYLNEWSQKYIYLNKDRIMKKPIYEVNTYNLFSDFYNPVKLSELTKSEWGINIYAKLSFVIVQDKIKIKIVNDFNNASSNNLISEYVINDFRPKINSDKLKILYFTERYKKDFEELFNSHIDENGHLKIGDKDFKEISKIISFLNNFLQISFSHWNEYLYIISPPIINNITYNVDYSIASILFRFGWELWEAKYQKRGEYWELINLNVKAIE